MPDTEEWAKTIQRQDENHLRRIQAELENNAAFKLKSPKERERLLKAARALEDSFIDAAAQAGLDRGFVLVIYWLLCSHTHAGYVSILQARDVTTLG